ncbi:MAG: hypothetical protein AMXMBFR13_29340 [Phycisphaerae bacterium]
MPLGEAPAQLVGVKPSAVAQWPGRLVSEDQYPHHSSIGVLKGPVKLSDGVSTGPITVPEAVQAA